MSLDKVKFASYIALIYIVVILGGIFLHFINTGDSYTLKYSLLLPSTWIATIVSVVIAWGLWQKYQWAWWAGLLAVLFQLVRMSSWLIQHFNPQSLPGFGVFLTYILLLAFFIVLIVPGTRTTCTK